MATLFGYAQEVARAGPAQCRCSRKPCSDLLHLAYVARRRARRQICTEHRSGRCDRYARLASGDSERERRHQKSARRAGDLSLHERSHLVVCFGYSRERDRRSRVYLCFRARFSSSPEGLGSKCRYCRGSTQTALRESYHSRSSWRLHRRTSRRRKSETTAQGKITRATERAGFNERINLGVYRAQT